MNRRARCSRRCRIDTSAVPQVIVGDMRPVSGPAELNQRMIESGKVEACLSANYFRYAMRRDPTRDSADACAYEAMRGSLASGGALAAAFRGIAGSRRLPPAQGGRAMKKPTRIGGCSSRARAAPCSPFPSCESLVPRRAAGQTATPPKRFIVLKTFSTQLVQEWYPRFTGNGYR